MRSRGIQLDLSPQGLISLKQNGVSDRVVSAAQQMAAGPRLRPDGSRGTVPVVTEVPPPPTR